MIDVIGDHGWVNRGIAAALAAAGEDVSLWRWDQLDELMGSARPEAVTVAHVPPADADTAWTRLLGRGPVVAVVERADVTTGLRLLAGGVGVLLDEACTDAQLRSAVEHARAGVAALEPSLLHGSLALTLEHTRHREDAREQVAHLRPRELELLGLVGAGLGNGQIARRRGTCESTVKAQVRDLLRALGGRSRFEAALLAHHAGLRCPRTEVPAPPEGDAGLRRDAKSPPWRSSAPVVASAR